MWTPAVGCICLRLDWFSGPHVMLCVKIEICAVFRARHLSPASDRALSPVPLAAD